MTPKIAGLSMSLSIPLRRIAFLTTIVLFVGCGGTRKSATPEPETPAAEPTITFADLAKVESEPTQLTFTDANNGLGSYSPDGSRIVFQSDRDGMWQVYELTRADSTERRLIESSSNDENPVWLADGSGLVFVSDRNSGGNELARDLLIMDVASGESNVVASNPGDDWYPVAIGGAEFLFLSERDAADVSSYGIYKTSSAGTVEALNASAVSVSAPAPAGNDAYLVRLADGKLGWLNAATGEQKALTPESMRFGTTSYSTARNLAVVTASESGEFHLFLFDPKNASAQKIETGAGEVRYPQFSPDGNRILYSREVEGKFQLFEVVLTQ